MLTIDRGSAHPERPFEEEDERDRPTPSLYVGLGASAGGLEPLREFFDAISDDTDAAFVVVQHLSPDYRSVMDELLSKNTSMRVRQASHGMRVEPNSVYLAPPRSRLQLVGGTLRLSEPDDAQAPPLPIDAFLLSLANDARQRSAAIVLSGSGSDGTRGLRAIKAVGGLVLVQDPDTAGFAGMPQSAVRTGLVDLALPPERLARHLDGYARRLPVSAAPRTGGSLIAGEETVPARIFELLRAHGRVDFTHYRASTVARRIERRMGINRIDDLDGYLLRLESDPDEVRTLARELLVNVTRFFRNAAAFEHVARHVIEPLVRRTDPAEEVRAWVAGCSTGEEAYSIAMLFDEARDRIGAGPRVKIFATDVHDSAIAQASLGRYPTGIAADVSAERLERHFSPADGAFVLRPEVRRTVVFATHDMIADPPFSNIDLVCCRNALIYFQQPVQQRIIASFHFALKSGGHLFLGPSESIGELTSHFDAVDRAFRTYRKSGNGRVLVSPAIDSGVAPGAAVAAPTAADVPRRVGTGLPPVTNLLRGYRSAQRDASFEHVKDALLEEHVPAALVLDADHRVVHLYGTADEYLARFPAGRVSTSVQDLIAPELAMAVGASLARAEGEGRPVHYSGLRMSSGTRGEVTLDLQTECFPGAGGRPSYFTVLIDEREAWGEIAQGEPFDVDEQARRRIEDLERELVVKQEHLAVADEKLESVREELQSTNEELMSSNEELQSANEELQSVNEELFTVNGEHRAKIDELVVANDDLDGVLAFIDTGTVFVDAELRVRKFTQVAARFFDLLPSDVGSPLLHVSNELEYPTLAADLASVVRDGAVVEREVFSASGELVEIRLVSHLSSVADGSHRPGAILTLVDLTSRTRLDRERHERAFGAREAAESAPDAANEPVSGPAHAPAFGAARAAAIGRALRVLVVDDSPEERYALARHLARAEGLRVEAIEADSVSSALAELGRGRVDLCLADFRFEDETANDLVAALEGDVDAPPVIVLSNASRAEIGDLLDEGGIARFIAKEDASPARLELVLRDVLTGSSAPGAERGPPTAGPVAAGSVAR